MSYDISLETKTEKIATIQKPFLMRGGNVPCMEDANGMLIQTPQTKAHVNITYNYARYFYEATKGDARFIVDDDNAGIRGLYGKTASDSIPLLCDMVARIRHRYQNEDGTWKTGKRTKTVVYDADGNDISNTYRFGEDYRKEEIEYTVSEGDTANYWESTAANAILALQQMLHLAIECIGEDVVWNGD